MRQEVSAPKMMQNNPGLREVEAIRYRSGSFATTTDDVVCEEPMEIIISDRTVSDYHFSVTMRTPGMDRELAVGYLFSEHIFDSFSDIQSMRVGSDSDPKERNTVFIKFRTNIIHNLSGTERRVNSSCGICAKSSVDEVFMKAGKINRSVIKISAESLVKLPSLMMRGQELFRKTGGIHSAALFRTNGELRAIAEDVGRHNAVDKVIGKALMENETDFSNFVLQVSGRCGFEILQKAAVAGIPIVSSVSAPTSLSVEVSRALGMTLVSFVRDDRFTVYSGKQRII